MRNGFWIKIKRNFYEWISIEIWLKILETSQFDEVWPTSFYLDLVANKINSK
jgi:hypothetical protein